MAQTIMIETERNELHGWTEIKWRCSHCHKHINLPQQQNFQYCMHCGAKVVTKIGGKVKH